MPFVHLHTHSNYSLLQGLSKVSDLVNSAKAYGMKALALTDHGNLYAAIPFYKKCVAAGIKPIIGVDFYLAEKSHLLKDPDPENRTLRLVLLAKNETGYKNLLKLVSISHLLGFNYRPRIDKTLLKEYSEGLIALSGDIQGEIPKALWANDKEKARKLVAEYKKIFGDDFYIEIMHHPDIDRHDEIMKGLIALARETKTPLVAAHGSYYVKKEDKDAHRTLLAVQSNSHLGDDARYFGSVEDFSFINEVTAERYFKDIPEALANTVKIADMCTFEMKPPLWIFPDIEIPAGKTYDEQLRDYAYKGFADRGLAKTKEEVDRLEYELSVIKDKGYAPYFLVVADLIYYARKNGILTTVRGSVAGSFVVYLIKITNVNPLEYALPFERFLNPERPSPPDIDMDFADDRRDEVIEYARKKYGEENVAQIGTFGTMLARGVVRDVARALGFPYSVGDRLAKMIPFGSHGFPMSIDKAMKLVPEFREAYEKEKDTKEIIDTAKKLEGGARHCSVHAAGVVIAPFPLTDIIPLQLDPKGGKVITQYDMHAIEDVGLLKFDFLGIRNLSILEKAVKLVKKTRGVAIDIENIPLDDKKTFEILGRGETTGLFQLGGNAMTRFLKDLKPTTIHDINAMVALFRPGPMKNIPEYIARKHGEKPITYLHPKMKKFLDKSYGILVYQDDLLSTALEIAGYTWGSVDKFRKAVGKKIPEEMAKQHVIFVEGCMKHSDMTKDEAERLWDLFEPFQGYGFNKAHAACYGRVAYQTAYMKANYPAEYMTAVLTAESGDVDEIANIIGECRRMSIPILPPDINESFGDFTALIGKKKSEDKIRFGLYTIKNLGTEIANFIVNERKEYGLYKGFADFLDRVTHHNLNRRSLEALIKSGAMDSFGERGAMLASVPDALTHSREIIKKGKDQSSIFGLMDETSPSPSIRLREASPATLEEKLGWEKELLGLYISGHPLERYRERFKDKKTIKEHKALPTGNPALLGGIIEEMRVINTKRGERMAFIKLSDLEDSIELVFFPSAYEKYREILKADTCVAIQGRVSHRNDAPSIVGEKVKVL